MTLDQVREETRRALAASGRRPAVVAHDVWLASGLETVLPETVLLCISRSTAVDELRRRGVEVFCLAEHIDPGATSGSSSLDLLRHPAAAAFCRRLQPLALLAFKPSERLAEAATALGARLLAGNAMVARVFENKLAFVDIARRAGVLVPRWRAHRVTPGDTFESLAAYFGEPLVLQGARGNAGQRTWLVDGEQAFRRAIELEGAGQVRMAAYIDGLPYTCTGLARAPGAIVGAGSPTDAWVEPCRQVTGVAWLTPRALGSCGNAWGDPRLEPHAEASQIAVDALARELGTAGYQGIFGVDFVLGAQGPVVIEVNPRMVASLPLATQLEAAAGRTPLLLRQLLVLLGGASLSESPDAVSSAPLGAASQVILHRLDAEAEDGRRPESGVYRLVPGGPPVWLRPGAWLSDLAAPDEALVLVKAAGQPVSPGKELARVYVGGSEAEHQPGLRDAVTFIRRPGA